jgi:hypothetical protein
METLFNLTWLAVAGIAAACWHFWPATTSTRRERAVQIVALAVLVAVLFPVISLTDDFQSTNAWAETEGTARKAQHAAHTAIAPAVIVFSALLAPAVPSRPASGNLLATKLRPSRGSSAIWISAASIRPPPTA